MSNLFQITAFTKTGYFSEVITAENANKALARGKKLILEIARGKRILQWSVTTY